MALVFSLLVCVFLYLLVFFVCLVVVVFCGRGRIKVKVVLFFNAFIIYFSCFLFGYHCVDKMKINEQISLFLHFSFFFVVLL